MIGEIIAACVGLGGLTTVFTLIRNNGKRVDTLDKTKVDKELFAQRVEQIDKNLVKGDKRFDKIEENIVEQTKISAEQAQSIAVIGTSMKSMNGTLARIENKVNNR